MLTPAALHEALGSFPAPNYDGLRQAAWAWAQAAAFRRAGGHPVPWVPVPVIPAPVPGEFVSRRPGAASQQLDHKQPGRWIAREGQLLACPVAWKKNWPLDDPVKAANRTVAAINLAERHRLPIGVGLAVVGGSGAVCLDADAKCFSGGEEELLGAMAPVIAWAKEHGLYVERSGSGGLHALGLLPNGKVELAGKFQVGDAASAGEVRGGIGNGFVVVAPTHIAGKDAPYTVLQTLRADLGAAWPSSFATIGITPAPGVSTRVSSNGSANDSNGHRPRRDRNPRSGSGGIGPCSGPGSPCPVCGRTRTSGCIWASDKRWVSCLEPSPGSAEAARLGSPAGGWRPGVTVTGHDGQTYAFDQDEINEVGPKRLFRLHDPSRPCRLPTPPPPRPEPELITGGPLAIAQRLLAQRQQRSGPVVLLNGTAPGFGKTRDVNTIADALLASGEVSLVVYCAADYRSPNDPHLAKWATVESRHNGIEEVLVLGTRRRRRRTTGSTARTVENPSCLVSNTLARLRAQGLSSRQEKAICDDCGYRSTCTYIRRQKAFLTGLRGGRTKKLRCAVQSLVALQAWVGPEVWARTVVILDEMPPLLSACSTPFEIPWDVIDRWRHHISWEASGRYTDRDRLVDLLTRLRHMEQRLKDLDREIGKGRQKEMFGLDAIELQQELHGWRERQEKEGGIPESWLQEPELPVVNLNGATIVEPLLLPALVRGVMAQEGFAVRVLPSGIEIVVGAAPEFHQALATAHGVLILDGTAHPIDVVPAACHGHPDALVPFVTDRRTGLDNILGVQITGAGPFASNRGHKNVQNEHRDRILEALPVQHPQLGVIDFKKHGRGGWGAWFSSSRGINAFSSCTALALIGVPNINLGAGLSQFAVLHRRSVMDLDLRADFDGWYQRRREEELLQAIHRLRPVRREKEWLIVYLLSDREVSVGGIHFAQMPAHALHWRAGGDSWCWLYAARTELIAAIEAGNQLPTMRHIAESIAAASQRSRKTDARRYTAEGARTGLKRALKAAELTWEEVVQEASRLAFDGFIPPPETSPDGAVTPGI